MLVAATGSRQGVLNPALYALAKAQYAAPATATACYANGQTSNTGVTTSLPAAACIFNDVTTGNNDVPCTAGSTDCFANSGASYGILSLTGSSSLTVAYASAAGYDQVTGIGSVNVANLIADWNTAFTSNTALQANPTSINSSQSTDLTATVTGGTPTGYVDAPPAVTGTITFKAGTTVVGNCTLSSGTCNATVLASSLQMGANSMTAIFGGSGTYPSFTSSIVTVTVETSSLITPTVTATPSSLSITTTQALSVTVVVSGGSGNPVPTGTVTLSGGGYSSAATTLSGGSAAINIGAGSMAMGSDTLTVTYTPDASSSTIYNSSTGSAVVVVTTQVTPTISWTPASAIILGSPGTNVLNATVSCGTTCGGITYTATPSGGSPVGITSTSGLALGVYTITANFTPLNPSEYNATSVSSTLTVSGESVWIVDGGGGTGELAGNGAAITSSADTGETTAVAIDAGGNVWTVGSGSLDETSQVGTVQNTVSSGSGGLHLPAAIAIDGNSQVWVTNGNNSVSLFSNAGTALSPSTGFTDSSLSTPTGIAIDPGGSVWIANKGNNSVTRILGGAAPAAPLSTAAANNTIGAKP